MSDEKWWAYVIFGVFAGSVVVGPLLAFLLCFLFRKACALAMAIVTSISLAHLDENELRLLKCKAEKHIARKESEASNERR